MSERQRGPLGGNTPTSAATRWVIVDLTNATNCHESFRSVECGLADMERWTEDEIRQSAANYFGVPIGQVARPTHAPQRPDEWDGEEADRG